MLVLDPGVMVVELKTSVAVHFVHKARFVAAIGLVEVTIAETDLLGIVDIASVIDLADIGPEDCS